MQTSGEYPALLSCFKEESMKKAAFALLVSVLFVPAATSAPAQDVTAPIHQFIDGFNSGNVESAFATYAKGDITIIDEFAPHLWTGPHAAQDWAADFDKNAKATGVTDPKVTYGAATRVETKGDVAYVVMPTGYLYKEKGKPMEEKGQITVVLNKEGGVWKMRGWTWSGMKPHPAR
jgi:ketosteroid isomerase-like protein